MPTISRVTRVSYYKIHIVVLVCRGENFRGENTGEITQSEETSIHSCDTKPKPDHWS